jgi:hypothetical protein
VDRNGEGRNDDARAGLENLDSTMPAGRRRCDRNGTFKDRSIDFFLACSRGSCPDERVAPTLGPRGGADPYGRLEATGVIQCGFASPLPGQPAGGVVESLRRKRSPLFLLGRTDRKERRAAPGAGRGPGVSLIRSPLPNLKLNVLLRLLLLRLLRPSAAASVCCCVRLLRPSAASAAAAASAARVFGIHLDDGTGSRQG